MHNPSLPEDSLQPIVAVGGFHAPERWREFDIFEDRDVAGHVDRLEDGVDLPVPGAAPVSCFQVRDWLIVEQLRSRSWGVEASKPDGRVSLPQSEGPEIATDSPSRSAGSTPETTVVSSSWVKNTIDTDSCWTSHARRLADSPTA